MAISDTIKKGMIRAPHRSLLRATGVVQSEADFDKPFIAVCNSYDAMVSARAWPDHPGPESDSAANPTTPHGIATASGSVPR